MMEYVIPYLLVMGGAGLLLYVLCDQLIARYFERKRNLVDDLVKKQKGTGHG